MYLRNVLSNRETNFFPVFNSVQALAQFHTINKFHINLFLSFPNTNYLRRTNNLPRSFQKSCLTPSSQLANFFIKNLEPISLLHSPFQDPVSFLNQNGLGSLLNKF